MDFSNMRKMLDSDIINKPKHYTQGSIQPIDFILQNNCDYCVGNIIKYVIRYKYKDGIQDLKKAEYYIKALIQHEQNKQTFYEKKKTDDAMFNKMRRKNVVTTK